MEYKVLPFWTKALDEDQGIIEGYAAIMGNRDSGGDRIFNGAFTKTIAENGTRVKVRWLHQEGIGRTLALKEVGRDELPPEVLALAPDATGGLWVQGKMTATTAAKDRMALMKDGVVDGLSIGYSVVIEEHPIANDWRTRDLKELKLHEWSPVDLAMNEAAVITDVKAAPVEGKPFPSEHACRLKDPKGFEDGSFRRTTRRSDGKPYSVIMGKLKGEDSMTEQAYRYPKDDWTAAQAKAHCKGHDGGRFEPASEGKDGVMDAFKTLMADLDDALADDVQEVKMEGDQVVVTFKEGRVLSTANRGKVNAAVTALQALLSAGPDDDDSGKSRAADADLALTAHVTSQARACAQLVGAAHN